MRLISLTTAILVTGLAMVLTIQPVSAATKTLSLTKTISLEGLSATKLDTVNGNIDVKPYDGNVLVADLTLEARAETKARAEELVGAIKIDAGKNGKWADVIATFPRTQSNEQTKVDIVVRIPASWSGAYNAETVNGNLTFNGLTGKSILKTTNGNISISDWSGEIVASTVNGNITGHKLDLTASSLFRAKNGNLTLTPGLFTCPLEVTTTNGIVVVELPSAIKANLETEVTNGQIVISGWGYDLTSKGTFKTKLGNGGQKVKLHVDNGLVKVISR